MRLVVQAQCWRVGLLQAVGGSALESSSSQQPILSLPP